jgi:hypothetical protein
MEMRDVRKLAQAMCAVAPIAFVSPLFAQTASTTTTYSYDAKDRIAA